MEIVLRVKQGNNPNFSFLFPDDRMFPFYRWIVENGVPVSRLSVVQFARHVKNSSCRVLFSRAVMHYFMDLMGRFLSGIVMQLSCYVFA